jgi:hypothetical protein
MRVLPLAHPRGIVGLTKVISVLRLRQPAALARRFTRRTAGSFRAVLLPSAVAHIDRENIAAAQALALYFVRHGSLAWRPIFADARAAAVEPRAPSPAGTKSMRIKRLNKFRPKNTDEENLDVQTAGIKR